MTGTIIIFLLLWLPVKLCFSASRGFFPRIPENCSPPLSCGDFHNIKCPFTLKGANLRNCSNPIELGCDENNHTIISLCSSKDFYVVDISYYRRATIQVVDPGIKKDNCSSMPQVSLSHIDLRNNSNLYVSATSSEPVFYMNCSTRVDSPYYVDISPCINSSSTYSYVVLANTGVQDLNDSCTLWMISAMKTLPTKKKATATNTSSDEHYSYSDIHNQMSNGFELHWGSDDETDQGCYFSAIREVPIPFFIGLVDYIYAWFIFFLQKVCRKCDPGNMYNFRIRALFLVVILLLLSLIGRFVLGVPIVAAFMINILRKRRRAMDPGIEDYLHDYKYQMPIRYSYNDVRRMAKNFKEKLGQGGYGSVFKGVLSNNHLIAIKIMTTTKGNGQEFINEVASIGRIHHVNVVRLIGFVAERSKRALVYEFMSNGSLEKYIFSREENLINPLSWRQIYEIALGIANGMDYLHRGCEMQILHFDIKPHNILLDENFIPKISDFGLAKLYSVGDSIVSMTAARGTMGYLAPELLYRNIGGVSYKSDVYSFGVMLLEMAGRRKNINTFAKNLSQIYFPTWIYDQMNKGKDIEMEDIMDEKQKELAKKMIIVGLWCIQMKPIDRPSMLKVIEMLEGDLELLQLPPKPNVLPDEDGNAVSID